MDWLVHGIVTSEEYRGTSLIEVLDGWGVADILAAHAVLIGTRRYREAMED